ncbi:DJ-1/PfpI family protein [Clostridium intestinale DSM 6191]|uniref:DJ-1/PfpI family protein n=1 Tax=Clostridium intestinale DSM 6191 TaxID=1121320 RepID=A0A1M5ZM78_9CLOT|nr:DJ-1/PfpI family protein [Clostridium intestinale DSM 6191]
MVEIYRINVVLFNDFETLDVFGPVEIFGCVKEEFKMNFISMDSGIITSSQGVKIQTDKYEYSPKYKEILFIPGGAGTRKGVEDYKLLKYIKDISLNSKYILTVCTGSALLAKSGLLDGREATSNKRAFNWVKEQSDKVLWIKEARWVKDGNIYTSSGVSAGIDMSLGFISDILGRDVALNICNRIEYIWNEDPKKDLFKVE